MKSKHLCLWETITKINNHQIFPWKFKREKSLWGNRGSQTGEKELKIEKLASLLDGWCLWDDLNRRRRRRRGWRIGDGIGEIKGFVQFQVAVFEVGNQRYMRCMKEVLDDGGRPTISSWYGGELASGDSTAGIGEKFLLFSHWTVRISPVRVEESFGSLFHNYYFV